jgi:hypothetical protein
MNVKLGSKNQNNNDVIGQSPLIQPKGPPMPNTNLKPDRSGKASHTFATNFQGDVGRKTGNIRAVTLNGKTITPDHVLSAAKAVQESLDATFGVTTTHDVWLETDRKAYELKDDVLTAFGRMKNASQ